MAASLLDERLVHEPGELLRRRRDGPGFGGMRWTRGRVRSGRQSWEELVECACAARCIGVRRGRGQLGSCGFGRCECAVGELLEQAGARKPLRRCSPAGLQYRIGDTGRVPFGERVVWPRSQLPVPWGRGSRR